MVHRPYFFTWTRQDKAEHFPVMTTQDVEIFLEDGRVAYDMISTNFQAAFGHRNQRIIKEITGQLGRLPIASPKAVFRLKEKQSERLVKLLGLGGGKIFYTCSGAEAVENALKMARQVSGKKIILARSKSYHGATLGALSVTGDWRGEGHFSVNEWTQRIPEPQDDPDLAETRRRIIAAGPENIAAFCLETISGMNGVIIPEASWWQGIQRLSTEFAIPIILDEVSCGFGRTGTAFAFHHYGIRPHFVCMAKAISGGYVPFGAVWTHPDIAAYYTEQVLSCGLTNYAHPLGLAAMKGVLDHFDDTKFRETTATLANAFAKELAALADLPRVKAMRSKGMLAAIELDPAQPLNWYDALAAGLHVACKGNTIILAPPLVMKTRQLRDAMIRLGKVLH